MSLKFDVAGDGPTLVLVHGVVHRRQAWDSVLPFLTPYRRVVTVDLPGHGESDPYVDSGSDVLKFLTAELSGLLREVAESNQPVHIGGNSLGGFLALVLAARGEVATATALSPAGFAVNSVDHARTMSTFRTMRVLARSLGNRTPAAMRFRAIRYPSLLPFFAHPSKVTYDASVNDAQSLTTNNVLDAIADFELPETTQPLVPITVAWGTRDFILPHYQRHVVQQRFPHARIISVPGVGHVPMTDNPELIASILLAGSERPA